MRTYTSPILVSPVVQSSLLSRLHYNVYWSPFYLNWILKYSYDIMGFMWLAVVSSSQSENCGPLCRSVFMFHFKAVTCLRSLETDMRSGLLCIVSCVSAARCTPCFGSLCTSRRPFIFFWFIWYLRSDRICYFLSNGLVILSIEIGNCWNETVVAYFKMQS
jgi:hypothetical protein